MELKERGMIISRPRAARMMKSENLKSIIKAGSVIDSNIPLKKSPYILNRNFKVTAPRFEILNN